jgi:hypothetical protein
MCQHQHQSVFLLLTPSGKGFPPVLQLLFLLSGGLKSAAVGQGSWGLVFFCSGTATGSVTARRVTLQALPAGQVMLLKFFFGI